MRSLVLPTSSRTIIGLHWNRRIESTCGHEAVETLNAKERHDRMENTPTYKLWLLQAALHQDDAGSDVMSPPNLNVAILQRFES